MGRIVPEDLDLASIDDEAERRVVESFRDRLSDEWLVLADVGFPRPDKDRQLDVVLVHPQLGVVDIEVKGHRGLSIERGQWRDKTGRALDTQPHSQVKDNAYALRNLLRERVPGVPYLHVNYGIALPNTARVDGPMVPQLEPWQVILSGDLAEPTDAVEHIATMRGGDLPFSPETVDAIVAVLRPDAGLVADPGAARRHTRAGLDDLCDLQVRTLETLDANRRVVVRGAAGTGKTRLALGWARRAFSRGERVLLTCFNEPLAERLAAAIVDDEALVVGPFLRLGLGLTGMPELPVPADATAEWWNTTGLAHLHASWHLVEDRFDTIVVDEAQDFSPAWLAMLTALLDPDGARRILLVADPDQALYDRGFAIPAADDGWTHAELVTNCRNARSIAHLLRRKLGGALSPGISPYGTGVRFVAVDGDGDQGRADHRLLVAAVRSELDRLVLDEHDPAGLMVLSCTAAVRGALAGPLDLHPWEARADGIVGQTVHRAKGLEADTVVLVADRVDVADRLLYVGISRAVSELVVVGPPGLGARLGLASEA